jgi:tetratricopeptide (TPR) repeat protein
VNIRLWQFLFLLWIIPAYACGQNLLDDLKTDLENERLDEFTLIEAAFIVSGTETRTEMADGLDWFDSLIADIQLKNIPIPGNDAETAKRLFNYMHAVWLPDYEKYATRLLDIQQRTGYNCVSATVLYNLSCLELGLQTAAFETPSHVYTIFENFTEHVMVENTSPMGFNIMRNLKTYSQYLAQYYPEEIVYQIGLDRLYAYENTKGREITNFELLGLICYNRALMAAEKSNYEQAYTFVQLAQQFNRDSRSNVDFEHHIYQHLGQQLFQQQRFADAFSLFQEAASRYPRENAYVKNCVRAFKNGLNHAWQQKNWNNTVDMILEMETLALLSPEEEQVQQAILTRWIHYFKTHGKEKAAQRAQALAEKIDGDEK